MCSNSLRFNGIKSIYAHEYKTVHGVDGRLSMQKRRGYTYDNVPSSIGIVFGKLLRAPALLVCACELPVAAPPVAEDIRQDAA